MPQHLAVQSSPSTAMIYASVRWWLLVLHPILQSVLTCDFIHFEERLERRLQVCVWQWLVWFTVWLIFLILLGMRVWFADTDRFLTQLLCCLYIEQDRDTSEVRECCASVVAVYIPSSVTPIPYVCIAAHLVLQQRQKDKEELEKRDQLKQLKKRVQQMVCCLMQRLFSVHCRAVWLLKQLVLQLLPIIV